MVVHAMATDRRMRQTTEVESLVVPTLLNDFVPPARQTRALSRFTGPTGPMKLAGDNRIESLLM